MTTVQQQNDFSQLTLLVPPSMHLTDEQLYYFCQANKELRIERNAQGELIIIPPTGGKTGGRNFNLTGIFGEWVRRDGTGKGFDSSTGYILPNRALRSPDVAWVRLSRWESLSEEEQEKFIPLCPDFVAELRSPSDGLDKLMEKMQEYINNGASLGWLIDPKERKAYIYRPQAEVEILENPIDIFADPLLPGFRLSMSEIWD